MELTAFNIYLLGILPSISKFLGVIGVCFLLGALVLLISVWVAHESFHITDIKTFNYCKRMFITGMLMILLNVFIPSREVAIGMVSIPYLVKNTSIKELPADVVDTITHLLRKYGLEEYDHKPYNSPTRESNRSTPNT